MDLISDICHILDITVVIRISGRRRLSRSEYGIIRRLCSAFTFPIKRRCISVCVGFSPAAILESRLLTGDGCPTKSILSSDPNNRRRPLRFLFLIVTLNRENSA
jgi:hypothetical protein